MAEKTSGPSQEEKDLAREFLAFQRELSKVRLRVQALTGESARPAVAEPSPDLRQALPQMQGELYETVYALDRYEKGVKPFAEPEKEWQAEASGPESRFNVEIKDEPENRTVLIRNIGSTLLRSPRLTVNARGDWHDIDTIVAQIIRPGMNEREKALAIWRFLVEERRHDNPAHPGAELNDPVKFLNVYGYGFCDDTATVLCVLAGRAGLQTRLWDLGGHVVSEVWFDGGWRMLDADGEVYYLREDGNTIAGVEDLQRKPELVRGAVSRVYPNAEDLVRIFGPENNRLMNLKRRTAVAPASMDIDLRPGESLLRAEKDWGEYFAAGYFRRPWVYGNGRLTYEPPLANFLPFCERAEGVAVEAGKLRCSEEAATVEVAFSAPYPILNGSFQATVEGASESFAVEFSEDGREWQPVPLDKDGARLSASLKGFFRRGTGDPVYDYHLRLSWRGAAEVSALRFASDIQVAPRSLPLLEQGKNEIVCRTGSPQAKVLVDFGFDEE